jgi:hypothetical protein
MVRDDGATAATVALDTFSDPRLWTPDEQADPSMYLHRLIVRRKHASIGAAVIERACQRAGQFDNHWCASTCGPTTSASTATTSATAYATSAHWTWPTPRPALASRRGRSATGQVGQSAQFLSSVD